jgi:hypothetical protein
LKPRLSVALGDVLYLDERWVLRIYAMSSVRQNFDYSVLLLLLAHLARAASAPLLRRQLSGSSLPALSTRHFFLMRLREDSSSPSLICGPSGASRGALLSRRTQF